jgi:hypothetical protein
VGVRVPSSAPELKKAVKQPIFFPGRLTVFYPESL